MNEEYDCPIARDNIANKVSYSCVACWGYVFFDRGINSYLTFPEEKTCIVSTALTSLGRAQPIL